MGFHITSLNKQTVSERDQKFKPSHLQFFYLLSSAFNKVLQTQFPL